MLAEAAAATAKAPLDAETFATVGMSQADRSVAAAVLFEADGVLMGLCNIERVSFEADGASMCLCTIECVSFEADGASMCLCTIECVSLVHILIIC